MFYYSNGQLLGKALFYYCFKQNLRTLPYGSFQIAAYYSRSWRRRGGAPDRLIVPAGRSKTRGSGDLFEEIDFDEAVVVAEGSPGPGLGGEIVVGGSPAARSAPPIGSSRGGRVTPGPPRSPRPGPRVRQGRVPRVRRGRVPRVRRGRVPRVRRGRVPRVRRGRVPLVRAYQNA